MYVLTQCSSSDVSEIRQYKQNMWRGRMSARDYLQYSKPDITSLKLLQASSSVKGFSVGTSNNSPFSNSSKTKKNYVIKVILS